MKQSHITICALLILVSAIATMASYPHLPAAIPVHWGIDGKPNADGPRAMLWLLGPGMMAAILLMGLCLPWLSPKRFDVTTFKASYSYFIIVLVCMLGCLFAAVLRAILTGAMDISPTIHAGVFVLLILLGNPMAKVKRNFFIGIRTPWTLASERVWYATHRLCGRLMVGSGLLGLIAVAVGAQPWILIALAGGWAFVITMFSLVYYKRLDKAGALEAR